jgi:sulfite reductase alpha subunit-like flavoprotein
METINIATQCYDELMSKISISYLTKYGNNKTAMEHLSMLLKAKGHEVLLFDVSESGPEQVPLSDLYVFSSSTHIGGLPGKMNKFMEKFPHKSGRYALSVTHMVEKSGPEKNSGKVLKIMAEDLREVGLTNVVDPLSLTVTGMKGPFEDGWQKKVELFAVAILKLLG